MRNGIFVSRIAISTTIDVRLNVAVTKVIMEKVGRCREDMVLVSLKFMAKKK